MAQVKTIGEAVRNMSVLMANMYYHLTKAVIEDFGDEAKESFKRAIIEFRSLNAAGTLQKMFWTLGCR